MRRLYIVLALVALLAAGLALMRIAGLGWWGGNPPAPEAPAGPPAGEPVPLPPADFGDTLAPGDIPLPATDDPEEPAPASGPEAPGSPYGAAPPDGEGGDNGARPPAEGDTAASARDILARTASAYRGVRGLRADFVQRAENPILRRTIRSHGTIFQRQPDRFLMRFEEPAGDVIVSDGRSLWVYYPSVDSTQVIRMAAAAGAGAMDLQSQFLGDPAERFSARLRGSETVDGRMTDILELTPRRPVGYDRLTVWVDRRDHLVRRFEITEENGVVRRFDLSGLVTNPALPDDLFRFEPPPGTRVVDRS